MDGGAGRTAVVFACCSSGTCCAAGLPGGNLVLVGVSADQRKATPNALRWSVVQRRVAVCGAPVSEAAAAARF